MASLSYIYDVIGHSVLIVAIAANKLRLSLHYRTLFIVLLLFVSYTKSRYLIGEDYQLSILDENKNCHDLSFTDSIGLSESLTRRTALGRSQSGRTAGNCR